MIGRATVASLVFLVAIAGCGGGDRGDAPFAVRPGDSVLVGTVTEVSVENLGGGFGGSGCLWGYDFALATGILSWTGCDSPNMGNTPPGARALVPPELTDVMAAIAAVKVSDGKGCGADKEQLELTVYRGSSDQMTYGDDFYACLMNYQYFVETEPLDALVAMLMTSAHS